MVAVKIKKMLKNVENLLAAASFAEAGEGEAAQSFLKDSRRVLLACKAGCIDLKTLKHAASLSQRVNARLDILYIAEQTGPRSTEEDQQLHLLETELKTAGVVYHLVYRTGGLRQATIDYTNQEKEILFAVVEPPKSLLADSDKKDTWLSELREKLNCPLVVVMGGAKA
jgi:hypothetical protein